MEWGHELGASGGQLLIHRQLSLELPPARAESWPWAPDLDSFRSLRFAPSAGRRGAKMSQPAAYLLIGRLMESLIWAAARPGPGRGHSAGADCSFVGAAGALC